MTKPRTGPPTDTKGIEISPTRIESFEHLCARRWAFGALFGMPEPSTDAQVFGTALHLVGENYYNDALLPDVSTREGKLFSTALKYLPVPGPNVRAEVPILGPVVYHPFRPEGFRMPGTADLVDVTALAQGMIDLYDYKTTSAKKWIKDVITLENDGQTNLYSLGLMNKYEVDIVRGHWVYFVKNGAPKFEPREFTITRRRAEEFWKSKAETVNTMLSFHQYQAQFTDVMEIPPSGTHSAEYSACKSFYRPCHFVALCARNAGRSVPSLLTPPQEKGGIGKSIFTTRD